MKNKPTSNNILLQNSTGCLALIDPDVKNDNILDSMISIINQHEFLAVLVGGSSISGNRYEERVLKIKKKINKPLILFPGSSEQISKHADAILFMSLLSGRNVKYLIEEQVRSTMLIKKYGMEVIPTGYLLIGNHKDSAVKKFSETKSLPLSDKEEILAHALAAQYFGMKYVFLEGGSGASPSTSPSLVKFIADNINIPIIVGGGIRTEEEISKLKNAGAHLIVLGNILEELPSSEEINKLLVAAS